MVHGLLGLGHGLEEGPAVQVVGAAEGADLWEGLFGLFVWFVCLVCLLGCLFVCVWAG